MSFRSLEQYDRLGIGRGDAILGFPRHPIPLQFRLSYAKISKYSA